MNYKRHCYLLEMLGDILQDVDDPSIITQLSKSIQSVFVKNEERLCNLTTCPRQAQCLGFKVVATGVIPTLHMKEEVTDETEE